MWLFIYFSSSMFPIFKDRSWPFSPVPERLLLSQAVVTHDHFPISPQASPICRTALLHRL